MIEYKIITGVNKFSTLGDFEYRYITYRNGINIISQKYYDNDDILIVRYNNGKTFGIRYLKLIR